jgi:hypothetical protein
MAPKQSALPTRDDAPARLTDVAIARLRLLATHVDFADLTARGVLEKTRGGYMVLNQDELPRHALAQVKVRGTAVVCGKRFTKLQFRDGTKKARAMLKKYGLD